MIVVTGTSSTVLCKGDPRTVDPAPWLKTKKSRKFMGVQDDLAVVAAGNALTQARLTAPALRERAGLFVVVGYIPFDEADIAPVLADSVVDGRFSVLRFSSGGYQRAHPLLTFRCLPNMPAYHVSANFDVQGPYLVSYPGPAQLYGALEEAHSALESSAIDVAVVVAVAHQRNFLVEHQLGRISPPIPAEALCDAGACIILERAESAGARGVAPLGQLEAFGARYTPHDPIAGETRERESFEGLAVPVGALGPASLLCALDTAWSTLPRPNVRHRIETRDHVSAHSEWRGAP